MPEDSTSLKVTPAATLMLLSRSIPHDWAATRRAPPMGTFSMVFGAANGNVNCCSTSAARASDNVEGPNAATDPTVCLKACHSDRSDEHAAYAFSGRSQILPVAARDYPDHADKLRCISRNAETPSINEWWNLL